METRPPVELGHRMAMIDGFDLGVPGRTGTYVLREEALTLVDTGPSPSVPRILKGLEELGLDPADVRYVIVTHIHLDHAGGAGLLLESSPCPSGGTSPGSPPSGGSVAARRGGEGHLSRPV